MHQQIEEFRPQIIGHCLIRDGDTGEILVDRHNAINFETMS
jgi:hypothetical protein